MNYKKKLTHQIHKGWMFLAASLLGMSAAFGHAPDQSYVFLTIEDDALSGHVDMAIADVNAVFNLQLAEDHTVTLADIQPHIDRIQQYVESRVALSVDGGPSGLPVTGYDLEDVDLAQYVQINFSFSGLAQEPKNVDFDYRVLFDQRPSHRAMAVIETNWKTGTFNEEANVVLMFEPGREKQSLALEETSVWTGFVAQIRSGMHHIWIGIDHILFLLALLLPAVVVRENGKWQAVDRFKPALIHVVKVVTVFTIAHTITLSLAALGKVSLPGRFVESVIALSIAIAAFDVLRPIFGKRIWFIVFAFGLFHGFGFASVLGDLGVPPKYLVHSLLGFNIGVEIGQLVIVAVIFPILYLLSRHWSYVRAFLPLGAIGLIIVSLYWFIERATEIDLPAGAIVNSVLAWFS